MTGSLYTVRGLLSVTLTLMLTNCWLAVLCQQDGALNQLAQDFWEWQLDTFPSHRNPKSDHLESFLIEDYDKRVESCKDMLQRCRNLDKSESSTQDLTTLKLLQYQLQTYIDGREWLEYGTLNPINMWEGVHNLPYIWASQYLCEDMPCYENYVTKLGLVPQQIEQALQLMMRAVQLNRTNYITSMKEVVTAIRKTSSVDPIQTLFFRRIMVMNMMPNVTEEAKSSLTARATKAIRDIQASYNSLVDFLNDEYLPNTRPEPGVWCLENGYEYYKTALQWHLSTAMTPEEVYDIGIAEVERIEKKMEGIIVSLGFGGDLQTFLTGLKTKPEFYNHNQDEYLQLYKTALKDRIEPTLPLLFNNLDNIPEIKVIPTANENSIAAAYGSSTVMVNTYNPDTRPYFTVLTIALHEGNPGHHMQMSVAATQDLPQFRKHQNFIQKYTAPFQLPYYTAFGEGWGLYAEYLGHELGLYSDDPYELFGRYCYEMLRACRLVVDTGIHAKRWSREQAVEYLLQYSISSRENIEIEVDRYITWPGQACAYKIGEIKILELRHRAEQALNPNFNIKDFHDVILKNGGVPLNILEEIVDAYIQDSIVSCSSTLFEHNCALLLIMCAMFCLVTNVQH